MRGSDRKLRFVEIDGFQIAYELAGEGPAVVLLHGFFGDHRVWRRQFELADAFTVVAWDGPGCGGSSTPPQNFRMRDYANALAKFLVVLGLDRPHLVGNSFGGTMALQLAALHPTMVRSVVASDTYAGWSGSFPAEFVEARLAQSLADLELPPEVVAAKWLPGFVTSSARADVGDELRGFIADFNPEGMRVMMRALAEADIRDDLPTIQVPVLLIWGEADVRSPLTVAEALHTALAGSRLAVLPGAGHLSQVEAADAFNAELRRFLASIP
jgi:pimeloyl-ACP methyl ester carboxylesterase